MSNVHVSNHPLVLHKLSIMRDKATETKKFREVVKELATLLLIEATADLPVLPVDVQTPMGTAHCNKLGIRIGLIPILRAGLGMVEGAIEMLPQVEVWHIGLYWALP
jgi:uracil phosphoribosyltransferase